MRKCLIAQIGEGIVSLINESGLAEASRQYTAEVDLKNLNRDPKVFLRSSVVALPTTQGLTHSRGARFFDVPFELLLVNAVDGFDIRDIDEVVGLYEELDQYIFVNGRKIDMEKTGTAAQWVSSNMDTNVNQDGLRRSNVVQVSGQIIYRYSR